MKYAVIPLYIRYIAWHYVKNLVAVLVGLAFAFAAIDYFQHAQRLNVSWNYKILYLFYKWEQALGLLYPLAVVFALIMTKLHFVKQGTMGIFHAFGFDKRRLLMPLLMAAGATYMIFFLLNTTSFAYAGDNADALLHRQMRAENVEDVFFKYNDTFVYMKKLDPLHKSMRDITLFKVEHNRVAYTMHAERADFDGTRWDASDVHVKRHIYDANGTLLRYVEYDKPHLFTLEGYRPKIIGSLYEGKNMNIADALLTWALLSRQGINTDKIRTALYELVFLPLFSLALMIILFIKIPYHRRMMHWGKTVASSLGLTFVVWGVFFGLVQLGKNGVLLPEIAVLFPLFLLWGAALYFFFRSDRLDT